MTPGMKLARYTKFREEKFGAVLFETRSEKVFTLNPTAAAVVREIRVGGDVPGIIERLKARFQDREGSIERDALVFITDLQHKGLLED